MTGRMILEREISGGARILVNATGRCSASLLGGELTQNQGQIGHQQGDADESYGLGRRTQPEGFEEGYDGGRDR